MGMLFTSDAINGSPLGIFLGFLAGLLMLVYVIGLGYISWRKVSFKLGDVAPDRWAVDVRKLVAELANQVFEEGRRLGAASTLPLLYRWRGKPYLGAAHGLVGVLNTLLYLPSDCCEV